MSHVILRVKLWGVRGSIPTPLTDEQVLFKQVKLLEHVVNNVKAAGTIEAVFGDNPNTENYIHYLDKLGLPIAGAMGGNTTCFEIQAKNSPLCIVDAGSGIRLLGNFILKERFGKALNINPLNENETTKKHIALFLTHYHWDHIQGFPFFSPAFIKDIAINIYGKDSSTIPLDDVLRGQQEWHYFPVSWKELPCKKNCNELGDKTSPLQLGEVKIHFTELDHPGGTYGYAFEISGKKIAITADMEHRDSMPQNAIKLSQNALAMYWDGQYLPEEYSGEIGMSKHGWGHSTYEQGVLCALAADVRHLIIGHNEPMRDDFGLKELEIRACNYRDQQLQLPENKDKKLHITVAQEGTIIEVLNNGDTRFIKPNGNITHFG